MKWLPVISFCILMNIGCKEKDDPNGLFKGDCDTSTCFVQGNNWKMAVSTNGILGYDQSDLDHDMNNAGGIFHSYSTVFASGLFVGATKNGVPSVTMARHSSEFAQGRITNLAPSAIEDLAYSDNSLDMVYIIDQGHSGYSWDHWPNWAGAPESGGEPEVLSAEDSWVVYHDADSSKHKGNLWSPALNPILGIVVRQSTYSFAGSTLEDVFFVRWRITNMSTINYTDMYVGLWCDADVIVPTDDLIGSDTLRKMIYVYNKNNTASDNIALGILPMYASGLGLLPTPAAMIEYFKVADAARLDDQQFNLMKGFSGEGAIRPNVDPNRPTYDFPGDPVSNTGIIDTLSNYDKRVLITTGSVVLSAGQTKEFVFAIIGSQGSDRLNSIVNLRSTADALKQIFVSQIAAQFGLKS